MAVPLPAGDPFDALGDPNRRAIVELLGSGERSVQEIADVLPISRPAVSRHLRLLKRAGLVVEERRGTRRIYQLHDHTVSAEDDLTVVLEPRSGGRIFERRSSGIEHDWGEVTIWEPPTRLGYTWHLNRDRSDATEVEIRFLPRGDEVTIVEIEHRGWERLGADGEPWRDRNRGGWATLLPHFVAATTPSSAS